MGADRAGDSAGQALRPSARGERAGGSERHLLRAFDRLPMAGAAEGPAAEKHGAFLLHAVGVGGTLKRIHHALYVETREREGREASPTVAIIDSQCRSKAGSAFDSQGLDAGKKVTGRKRHILVDTLGLLLSVIVHPADVQDRDGAFAVLPAHAACSPSSN